MHRLSPPAKRAALIAPLVTAALLAAALFAPAPGAAQAPGQCNNSPASQSTNIPEERPANAPFNVNFSVTFGGDGNPCPVRIMRVTVGQFTGKPTSPPSDPASAGCPNTIYEERVPTTGTVSRDIPVTLPKGDYNICFWLDYEDGRFGPVGSVFGLQVPFSKGGGGGGTGDSAGSLSLSAPRRAQAKKRVTVTAKGKAAEAGKLRVASVKGSRCPSDPDDVDRFALNRAVKAGAFSIPARLTFPKAGAWRVCGYLETDSGGLTRDNAAVRATA